MTDPKPLYQTEFKDFDDLTAVLAQLPVTFIDQSWHNDSCPSFYYSATSEGDEFSYPRLLLWIDYADGERREVQRDRFMLELLRCEGDYGARDIKELASSEDLAPITETIDRVTRDGITMRLYTAPNAEGLLWLYLNHEDMAIENPFLSECGRFPASPRQYGLDAETGAVFLNAMPMDQLRDVMSAAVGNSEVFDSLATDAEKREFAVEYLTAALQSDVACTGH